MKTTVEIADALFEQVKRHAAGQGITIRAVIEQGLRQVLAAQPRAQAFRFEPVTFKGDGPAPGCEDWEWARVRDLTYEGRGT
jgi:hypothetical protein